ncbi:MAG: NAD(P)H-dependent flavin oxidoreductase [Bacilli bacterium]
MIRYSLEKSDAMKSVKIKDKVLKVPIIQGGMGVGVSLSNLAGNVMKQDCLGVISAAQPGYDMPDFKTNNYQVNYDALIKHAVKARAISEGKGLLGVNIMVAMEDYANMVKAAVEANVDVIISGAGIPMHLPKYAKGFKGALAPIVSSGKVAEMICRKWDKSYQTIPDLIIIEGPQAAGHLGFKREDIIAGISLESLLFDVKEAIKIYEEKYERKIPIFVAGGIYTNEDINKYLKLGASGVQMGSRFIATYECDAHINFKQAIIDCKKEDIIIVGSPVGLPGRALSNDFTKTVEDTRIKVNHCYNCIIPCNPATTQYCISEMLIKSVTGDVKNGLVFCGSEAYRIDKLLSVKELIDSLKD